MGVQLTGSRVEFAAVWVKAAQPALIAFVSARAKATTQQPARGPPSIDRHGTQLRTPMSSKSISVYAALRLGLLFHKYIEIVPQNTIINSIRKPGDRELSTKRNCCYDLIET